MMKVIMAWILLVAMLSVISPAFAAPAKSIQGKTVIYASLDTELSRYELDVPSATLTKLGSVTLPANVQFAAFHPSGHFLYVISSNAGNGTLGAAGDKHLLSVLKIDQTTGALQQYGQSVILPERPIHVTVDRAGEYALVAFNQSGTVRVFQIMKDGTLGEADKLLSNGANDKRSGTI